MKNIFEQTFSYKLIYVFGIPMDSHKGLLKIGEATVSDVKGVELLSDNSEILNIAAKERIDSYTKTAGIRYELFYTTLAIDYKGVAFRDNDVHNVLKRSGIQQPKKDLNGATEWFKCDLETVKRAIIAVKEGRSSLNPEEKSDEKTPIIFRPEQKEAITLTLKQFRKGKEEKNENAQMLWNAKMRFGKTLSALEVVKQMRFKKTIIITHRPVVKESWYEDFEKIFYDREEYLYGSKSHGEEIDILKKLSKEKNISYIYFASIQDLRESSQVGGKFDKNDEIFNTKWDFVIVDEAHEGTQTSLGNKVIQKLIQSTSKTKTLYLSGTPFNLLSPTSKQRFKNEEVYTWDYVMEQRAKLEWVKKFFGDSNPYESLPKMNIFTYDLAKIIYNDKFTDIADAAFNFREFFRVWTGDTEIDRVESGNYVEIGKFVYEKDIIRFLDLLVESGNHNYPFSSQEYRDNFRHTLWMVPGVKEAKALADLLREHYVFKHFNIKNVAGEEEINGDKALDEVKEAIGDHPEETRTITLSCGRLTTGVTVPAWTAVFMLSGSSSTSASSYLQTIFRVQTPAVIGGKMKTNCYVFDFAPDRTLKIIAEAGNLSAKAGAVNDDRTKMGDFLNFCPVIGIEGSEMKYYNPENMLVQLKRAIIDRVVRNGFDDTRLYNDKLLQLSEIELEKFKELGNILKATKTIKVSNEILINDQGLDSELREKIKDGRKKRELTEEEKAILEERRRKQRERTNAIATLRGIAIRIPLLIYGADIDVSKEIDVNNFPSLIDDLSWEEFMPKGVTKKLFAEFSKYFDNEVFIEAGLKIRRQAKAADELPPLERVQAISNIFSTFRNPDKETVLTPWNVVNMHLGECIGGANFYDEKYENQIIIDENTSTRWIDKKEFTDFVFDRDSKILEINSKTGLYPLYCATSLYQNVIYKGIKKNTHGLWKEILEKNIFVICRTKMAAAITRRTLRGYKNDIKVNIIVIEDITEQMSKQYKYNYKGLVDLITNMKTWKKGETRLKFNAVVGNPPYQKGNEQIYTDFYLISRELGEIVSLIFPIGWQEPKDANNLFKLNNPAIKKDKQIIFIDNRQNVFPGIAGAEWTNFILWKRGYDNKLDGKQRILTNGENPIKEELLIAKSEIKKPKEILELGKIVKNSKGFKSIYDLTSARKPYGLAADVIKKPENYNLPKMSEFSNSNDDYSVIGLMDRRRVEYFIPKDYPIPKKTKCIDKYKIFIPKAWGNMDEKAGLGGAYADIIISKPNQICTESYIEQGCYEDYETSIKHAKYLMTRFCRALFYIKKFSQNTPRITWEFVPTQDFSEEWWSESIEVIEDKLFEKYDIPENIKEYVKKNIQKKDESNIIKHDT